MKMKNLCEKCNQPEYYHRFNQKKRKVERIQYIVKPQRWGKKGKIETRGFICSKCVQKSLKIYSGINV